MTIFRKDTNLAELPESAATYKIQYPTGIIKVGRTNNLRKRMWHYRYEDLIREKFEYIELLSYKLTDDPVRDERELIAEMSKMHLLAHGKEWFIATANAAP